MSEATTLSRRETRPFHLAIIAGLACAFLIYLWVTDELNVDKFNAAMTELTRLVTPDILRSYDFSGISHLMDVGGGSGELLGAIAQQNRHLRGTVFELPRCAEAASRHDIKDPGVEQW